MLKAVAVVIAVVVVVFGVSGAAMAFQAQGLKASAKSVLNDVSEVQSALVSGDYAAAEKTAQKVSATAKSVNDTLSGPQWLVGSLIPVLGDDVRAARTLGEVLNDVSSGVLVPMTQALGKNPPAKLVTDGAIDVASLNQLVSVVGTVAPVMNAAAQKVEAMPATHVDQVTNMVAPAKEKLTSLNEGFQMLGDFAPILGSMLGSDRPRNYLIVAQGTNELRAAGGFAGSCGLLTVENGKLDLGHFSSMDRNISYGIPDELFPTSTEIELFTDYIVLALNENYNPNFVRCGEIWAYAYEDMDGTKIDGVFSVVPSVVQDLLAITGAITLSDGTVLDGTNATKVLQNDIYWKYFGTDELKSTASKVTDELFSEAAHGAFDKLLGSMDSTTLMKFGNVAVDCLKNRRIMLWFADSAEQAQVVKAGCSGGLNSDPTKPELGTYITSFNVGKIGWYVDMDTTIGEGSRNADGTVSCQCTTVLHNAMTAEEAKAAPLYIAGHEREEKGIAAPMVYFFAPMGGTITDLTFEGGAYAKEMNYQGLQVFYMYHTDNQLPPGCTITATYTVTVSADAKEDLKLSSTPMLSEYRRAAE